MELSESTVFYIHYRILRKAKVKLHQNLRALDSIAQESFPTQLEIISISNCAQQGLKSLRTDRILRPRKNGAVGKKTDDLINRRNAMGSMTASNNLLLRCNAMAVCSV